MPTLSNPWSGNVDTGDPVVGADLGSWLDAIRTVVNGLDNNNIAASAGISLSKLEFGTIYHWLGASSGHKIIFGSKSVTLDNTTWNGGGVATVTFTTDADTYGSGAATNFSAAPIVVTTPVMAEGASPLRYTTGATSISTSGFTLVCMTTDVAASTASVTVNWIAIGAA